MGFFDSLVSGLGKVLTVAAPIVTGFLGGQAAQAAGTVAAVGTAVVQTNVAASQILAQTKATAAQVGAPIVAGGGVTGPVTFVGDVDEVGMAKVRTVTIIRRVARVGGAILSEVIKQGSPFLMNKEVAALRKVSKLISRAAGKIPRKPARISEKALTAAVGDRIQQLNAAQCLLNGNGCPK